MTRGLGAYVAGSLCGRAVALVVEPLQYCTHATCNRSGLSVLLHTHTRACTHTHTHAHTSLQAAPSTSTAAAPPPANNAEAMARLLIEEEEEKKKKEDAKVCARSGLI